MKVLHKRILSVVAVAFMAVLMVFTSAMQPQATVFAAGTNETQFEKTNVLDDLQSSKEFNIQNYPFQETDKPQMHVINVIEYCYSFRANQRGNYGLYLYVYNPNGQDILTDSIANKVQIAVKYDTTPITSESKPTDYEKFRLQFCSKSAGEYKNLFYKFKVMDHVSADGKTIAERVNSMARRYDISGIELHTRGKDTADEYPLTGAYALSDTHEGYGSFTFTGYAKGYGADEEAESTLDMSVSKLETVKLNVKHTFYRTETATQAGHQNQIDTVYFSVPKRLFDDYGTLQRIKAEWYEYRTSPIFVTSNKEFFDGVSPYVGRLLPYSENHYSGNVSSASDFRGYVDDNIPYWFGKYDDKNFRGYLWNTRENVAFPAEYLMQSLCYLIPTANWCDIKEYDPYADNVEAAGGVSSNRLYEYIKTYDKSFINGTLPIKTQSISADLFEDDIDESRKMDNERGKIQKGYSYYDFDAKLDLQSWQGWGDSDHSFWENTKLVGFWNALFGKVPDESGKSISPIQVLEKDSPLMKLSDTELTDELFINYADVAELRKEYNDAITVSGKDDEEKVVVLFRFAVTDYVSEMVNLRGNVSADGKAYVAQETVFFDFDIIQLSFLKGEDWTIIPCVSSPIDIVNAITTPTHIPDDTPWWYYVVATVLFVLVVVIVYKLIKGGLSLIFKR